MPVFVLLSLYIYLTRAHQNARLTGVQMHTLPIKLILVPVLTGPVKSLPMHVEAYNVLRHDGAVRKGRGVGEQSAVRRQIQTVQERKPRWNAALTLFSISTFKGGVRLVFDDGAVM